MSTHTRAHSTQEYLSADSSPEAVLIAGWSEIGFMGQLLWELDQGASALPPGKTPQDMTILRVVD